MEKLSLRRSARKDSELIEKLVYEYYFNLAPVADGFEDEEEFICKKIVDKDGNIIAGCTGFIFQWGCIYVAFYLKHGYSIFGTIREHPVGHEDYVMFKRLDTKQINRQCKPIDHEILDGDEEDGEYIDDELYEYNLQFINPKHDYIKINRKLVDKNGKVVAAIMAGVSNVDAGWIWKIWVDEEHRHQGLGSLLIKHFEKKAKEKGATKIIAEEIYDWNVGFFLKNGYRVAGKLPDLPENHTYFVVDKDL